MLITKMPGLRLSPTTVTPNDVILNKTVYSGNGNIITGTLPIYNGTIIPPGIKPIIGKIFYVDNEAMTSATYTFYDNNYNVIQGPYTVENLVNAYHYTITGRETGDSDKFYAYDNTTHTIDGIICTNGLTTGLQWGQNQNSISGYVETGIGYGKSNTLGLINEFERIGADAIFNYINYCNEESKIQGAEDWFLPSRDELIQLLLSSQAPNNIPTEYLVGSYATSGRFSTTVYYTGGNYIIGRDVDFTHTTSKGNTAVYFYLCRSF